MEREKQSKVFSRNSGPHALTSLPAIEKFNSMEQNPSSETNGHSASQKIPRLTWNTKVHFRVHKGRPLGRILIQMQPVHTLHHFPLRSILLLSSRLLLGLPSVLFPSGLPIEIFYAFITSPMRATFPFHFVLLDLITLIIFGGAPHCPMTTSNSKTAYERILGSI